MSTSNLITTTGIAIVIAAAAGGTSFALATKVTEASIERAVTERLPGVIEAQLNKQNAQGGTAEDKRIEQAIASQLPAAIEAHQLKQQALKVEAAKTQALSGWAAADKAAPAGQWIYGGLKAEFTLVEFSDVECPFCKRFHDTPKSLVDQAGGKLNWEWQHYPLPFHNPAAELGAHGAECVGEIAGNQAFWAYLDQWFKSTKLNGQGVEDMASIAQNVGAPVDQFTACMDSGRHKEKIKAQMDRGTAMGVNGTPATVVVDNLTGKQMLVSGAVPPQAIIQAMKDLAEQRNQPAASPASPEPAEKPTEPVASADNQ